MTKRVDLHLSDEVYEELLKIAEERGETLSDVLRDAVTLRKFTHEMETGHANTGRASRVARGPSSPDVC